MGSLLDGIETAPAPSRPSKSVQTDSAKKVKLAVAIAGLAVGGALIAWNFGLFSGTPLPPAPAPATPLAPSAAPPQVRKVDPPRAIDAPQVNQPTNELIEQRSR